MVTTKPHFIVVEKYGDNCMEYQRDEVLLSSTTDGNTLFSTANNGTILITPTGVEFGPNCPNGVAVYDKF